MYEKESSLWLQDEEKTVPHIDLVIGSKDRTPVIRLEDSKGYGFIKPDEDGEDLFVHQSEIQSEGYRNLEEGQKVKFLVVEKNNRQHAVNVGGGNSQRKGHVWL
ncbi:hypothetical protein R6Q57_004560 [Mikania cordata]